MTNKEALKEIKLMLEGIDAAECFDYDIINQEHYKAIEKDLEILAEIKRELRKNNIITNGRLQELLDMRCSDYKRWLENE